MKRKVTPKDHTRSIELILRDNPNMTGKEILEEQKHDEACFALWKENRDKDKLDFIKDINTNGGFYKGRFGLDQRFYYKVTNASLQGARVMAEVETVVVFLGCERGAVKVGDINIEKRKKTYEDLDNYDLHGYTRTTKEDFEKVVKYLNDIAKFWE